MRITITNLILIFSMSLLGQDLQMGLVGYYQFDNNMEDASSIDIAGIGNNVILGQGIDDQDDTCYEFNGQNSIVNLSSNNRTIEKEVSISAWVKTVDAKRQFILSKYFSSEGKGYFLGVDDGKVVFGGRNGSKGSNSDFIQVTGKININDGEWHHITAVSSENEWVIYTDCNLDNMEMTNSSNLDLSTSTIMTVGNWVEGTGYGEFRFFNGSIDEIRLYNRALEEEEIELICNRGIVNSIGEIAADDIEMSVYPNPASKFLKINSDFQNILECSYEIISTNGQVLFEGIVNDEISLDGLGSGLFYLRVSHKSKYIGSSSFIKGE